MKTLGLGKEGLDCGPLGAGLKEIGGEDHPNILQTEMVK